MTQTRPDRPLLPAPDTLIDDDAPRLLRDQLHVLYKHRRLAAVCFGVTVAAALVVSLLLPRRYTATTRLEVARRSPIQLQLDGIVHRAEQGDGSTAATALFLSTQIATLQSRDLAAAVIGDRRLAQNPAFVGGDRSATAEADVGGLLAELYPRGWEKVVSPAEEPADTKAAEGPGPVDEELVDRYMRALSVREVRGTDLIQVGFTTASPTLSAFLAAAHTQAYLEANERARLATDRLAGEFLTRQLAEARQKIEQAEIALGEFGREHPDIAADREHRAMGDRITELAKLVSDVETERATLESRYEFLSNPGGDATAYFLDSPGVQKLRMARLDVYAARAALGSRLGPNHPQMRQFAQLESEITRQLHAEVEQGVAGVRAQYDATRARETRLRRKLSQQEEAAVGLRALEARHVLLQGELDGARTLHASLLKQRAETAVNSNLVATNVRVIERPEIPRRPSQPNVPLNMALGLFGGTVLALGAAFGREYFDASVGSSAEVEGILRLPALAAIPNFELARAATPRLALPGNGSAEHLGEIPMVREPWSQAAEAFRSARTAVLFSRPDAPPQVVLVTSARMGEGKTVASVNLATALAESGARVLLIDADLRHPRCHATLGVANDQGLSSVLENSAAFDVVVHRLDEPRLDFLAAGPPPANPAGLLGSPRVRDLLRMARSRYDFVVLDTSPVLPVTDAVLLARAADGVVLVVKGHDTPREVLRRARDRLSVAGATFLGVMVNNVGMGWGDPEFHAPYDRYYGVPAVSESA